MHQNRPTIEIISRRYLSFIRWVLFRHRVLKADVDDVAQALLLSVNRSLHTYDPSRGELRTWLYRIAQRFADVYRRRKQRALDTLGHAVNADFTVTSFEDDALDVVTVPDPAPSSEERMMQEEDREFLHEMLKCLPPSRRETFELHAIGGMTDAEVAELLDISRNTVKSRVAQAWVDLDAAVRRQRARDRRGRGLVFPLSAAALVERERARVEHVPEEVRARLLEGALGARAEQEHAAAADGWPSAACEAPPARLRLPSHVPLRTFFGAAVACAMGGGALGASTLWALTRPASQSVTVNLGGPDAPGEACALAPGARALPAPGDIPAPPPSLDRAPAPPSLTLASLLPDAPPPARKAPAAGPPAEISIDPEEALIRTARQAIAANDREAALEALEHHEGEFPNGRLMVIREVLRARLQR